MLSAVRRSRGESDVIALLADCCQQRLTTAIRLGRTVDRQPRLPRRRLVRSVLDDVSSGTHSLLVHRYLTRVERAHGLPVGTRQQPFRDGRSGYRDVVYAEQRVLVELDGRLGHDLAQDRWDDLDRDLRAVVGDLTTVRAGWGQVENACLLADRLASILRVGGWSGSPRPCGADCPIRVDRGGSRAPGADDPPRSTGAAQDSGASGT